MPSRPFWRQVFEDDKGNPSSTRILVVLVTLYCLGASTLILSIWAYLSLTTMKFIPLGLGEIGTLVTSITAILFKVVSKKYEERYTFPPEKKQRHKESVENFEGTMFKEVDANGQE